MQIVLNPETKISGIKNINTREQRRISFCGVDEFIKTAPSGNFAEMKKAIQMKYRPAISQLRAERKEIADAARTAIMSEIIQSKSAETILFNINYENELKQTGKKYPVRTIKDKIASSFYTRTASNVFKCPNCVMLVSKDKAKGETLFQNIINYIKTIKMVPIDSFTNGEIFGTNKKFILPEYRYKPEKVTDRDFIVQRTYYPFRLDFKTLEDSLPANADKETRQKALFDALNRAEENFRKTGRGTVLHVRDMEQMIDSTKNSKADIAIMKDLMDKSDRYFHTLITFTNTDPTKSDPGTLVSHRVGYRADLDALGVTKSNINAVSIGEQLQRTTEKAEEIYRETGAKYDEYTKRIEALQAQCRDEVSELEKKVPKTKRSRIQQRVKKTTQSSVSNIEEKGKSAAKKYSVNKKAAIIAGIIAAAGTALIILYKKGILKKLIPQKKTPAGQTKQSAERNKAVQTINTLQASKVFSDFDSFIKK